MQASKSQDVTITFYKYQGTGNDFVVIDNRLQFFNKNNTKLIRHMCDRRFGIGADGVILLENSQTTDFEMCYFNADGKESSMCGNGGRCIAAFASFLGIVKKKTTFTAIDGIHSAYITKNNVALQMQDVIKVEEFRDYFFLNTGSPHHVQKVTSLKDLDVKGVGKKIRYGKYGSTGSNINFVARYSDTVFMVRTYERGVEDETFSCGTGVTAVALAMHYAGEIEESPVLLQTPGGMLEVSFEKNDKGYKNIILKGDAVRVFKGDIIC